MEVQQGPEQTVYSLVCDGKLVSRFASVARVRRPASELEGYQRPEVAAHIRNIRRYLESGAPLLPNALVVAFDGRVRFEPTYDSPDDDTVRHGTLIVPIDEGWSDQDKPGWIVDGQQRSAAIREAVLERFPILIAAFVSDDAAVQREQFLLVNSSKPLPRGLIHELLPGTGGRLPPILERRRFPAELLVELNTREDSPFFRIIRTPTNPVGVVQDNSILRMLENSLTDGALYGTRDPATGIGDAEAALAVLVPYWEAVAGTFPEAWGQPPRRSRLSHGAGIVAMGLVMDAIAEAHDQHAGPLDLDIFARELELIRPTCRWNEGEWSHPRTGERRRWNDLQNTPKDTQWLADLLLATYREFPTVVVNGH
jgi:DGQHR domain-containing protein